MRYGVAAHGQRQEAQKHPVAPPGAKAEAARERAPAQEPAGGQLRPPGAGGEGRHPQQHRSDAAWGPEDVSAHAA